MPIWRNTTGDGLWGTAGNWIADGSGNSGVPTSATDAIFDSLSPSCTVNTQARPCANLNTTGYTGTTTFTFDVQVNGNVTLGAGMLFAGTGFINIRFTANGQTRTLDVASGLTVPRLSYGTPAGGFATTIISVTRNTTITNLSQVEGANTSITINPASGSVTIRINNGTFAMGGSSRTLLGANTTIEFNGSCILSGGSVALAGGTIKTLSGSTLTVNNNWFYVSAAGTIDFSLGSVNFTTTIFQHQANCTINFPPSVGSFYDFRGMGITLTLLSNVSISRDFLTGPAIGHVINGPSFKLSIGRDLILANSAISGTATLSFEGTTNGSIVPSGGANPRISNTNLVIDKGTGTLTFNMSSNQLIIDSPNYTVTSGIVVQTGTANLIFSLTQTITHTVPATYNNITASGTKTLSGNVWNIAGTLTVNATVTFAGTTGWTAANFIDTTAGTTITLQSGINYTVTSNLRLLGTNASPILISSSSPTTRAFLTLNYGASMLSGDGLVSHAVYFVRATRIDSSLGQTIWNTFGSISTPLVDTVNWNPGSRPNPTSYTYII